MGSRREVAMFEEVRALRGASLCVYHMEINWMWIGQRPTAKLSYRGAVKKDFSPFVSPPIHLGNHGT